MKSSLYILMYLCSISIAKAQISGDCGVDYNTANELVEILIGEGIEYSNATFSGFDCSAGYFDGTSNIGFESGLVMATNGVSAITPGGQTGLGSNGDVEEDLTLQLELVNASATNVNNLIVLEFDFIPTSDTITFEYVFASNEYPGYTCSQFNDIFGFFLAGPDINTGAFANGAVNLAMVPDPNNPGQYTDTPVIINTINSGTPSGGDTGPCDNIDPNWQDYSVFFTDNSGEETVSYPGFTVALTAMSPVTPCETYHIKLAVADVSDGALNSAVFLKEGSFSSIPENDYSLVPNSSNIFNPTSPYIDNLYEGCGTSSIIFNRPGAIDVDLVFDFNLSGTATEGVDYSVTNVSNNQVTMPVGQSTISIDFNAVNDGLIEGEEQIVVEILPVDYGCYITAIDTIVFDVFDQPDLDGDAVATDALCPGDPIQLTALPIDGMGGLMQPPYMVPPYTYQWSGLGNAVTETVSPMETEVHCVDITDVCGQEVTACVEAVVEQYPDLEITMSDEAYLECPGDVTTLSVEASGGMGSLMSPPYTVQPYTYQWIGLGNNSSQSVSTETGDVFCVDVTDACGQELTGCVDVNITVHPDVIASSEIVYVCDSVEKELCAFANGGNGEYTYEWSNGETSDCIDEYPGVYTVEITDGCGESEDAEGEVYLDEAPDPFFQTYQAADEDYGITLVNYTPEMEDLSYSWDFGDEQESFEEHPGAHTYEEWGEYMVTLGVTTAINNCYKEIGQIVQVAPLDYFYAPNTFSPNGDLVNDGFKPSVVGAKTYEIFIYDRWGKEVFHSTDIDEYWYGEVGNEEGVQGTYVFKVYLTKNFDQDKVYTEIGYVNLLR